MKKTVNEDISDDSNKTSVKPKVNTVDIIDQQVYESIKREADTRGMSFRKYVNEQLEMIVRKEKFIRDYMPKLSKLAFDEGILFIKDKENSTEIARIGISKKGLVHCTLCKSETCIHVMYALAMPELGRLDRLNDK